MPLEVQVGRRDDPVEQVDRRARARGERLPVGEALELLARGTWDGAGVLGPEAFDAVPFLDLLTEYGSPWGQRDDEV